MSRSPLLLALLCGCAANTVATGEGELSQDASDASVRRDASSPSDASVHRDASTARSDASTSPGCAGDAAHGCYTLTDDSPTGCPKQAPEIPLGLPSLDQWDLCNAGAVTAGQTCVWEGPEGGTASCLCDTGVHWLCVYL